jgi:hypothetical protein
MFRATPAALEVAAAEGSSVGGVGNRVSFLSRGV